MPMQRRDVPRFRRAVCGYSCSKDSQAMVDFAQQQF
jgi:hypothetical protein